MILADVTRSSSGREEYCLCHSKDFTAHSSTRTNVYPSSQGDGMKGASQVL
ncbi:Uncharacterized protein TCM_011958 [Theobroma cacao]|uniref:Uncharacterized protein n=1 Tax=Theobroma cacao TaxID=3641 RepID=A0A061FUK5_THECC|nr:Uncharacterized protein TCM_011958 [Theobroma cacao]